MSAVVSRHEVTPAGRVPAEPCAHVAVLVSLSFPGMDEAVAALVRRFTRVALETLVRLGASYELMDTSTPLADPSVAGRCDGLLLLGGGDIAGSCYGSSVVDVAHSYGVDERADRDAFAAIDAAEAAGLPVLGICRGAQLINVHRGGTIVPDLEDHVLHHGGEGEPLFLDEKIHLLPHTRLHAILGADRIVGRSGHHQAVAELGTGLRLGALAEDGVVEGFDDPSGWVVGVQWHPEDDDGPRSDRLTLFGSFVTACAERRRTTTTTDNRGPTRGTTTMDQDDPTRTGSTQYAVRDPRTGQVVQSYPTASAADIEAALERAATAYADWGRRTTLRERAELVGRVADLHEERQEELADLIVREMGKPRAEALGEIGFCAAIYRYYADNAESFLADEPIDLLDGTGTAVVRRAPVGVLLGIMPWNFPGYQVARFAGPNLVAGNTVVLKHAPQCPSSAEALQRIFLDAGLPQGAYVNVYATNEQVAEMIADPRVQGVSLTGSERAGAAVAEVAGRNLKKVVLELGGSDPFIVLGASDLDATVQAAVDARVYNTGQACNAGKRFIVLEELYDDFVTALQARLAATSTDSPLSSQAAADNLAAQVDRAVGQGAELQATGERDGAFFPAGVLLGVTADNDVFHEELFGPVAMVFKVRSEDEAVQVANDTPFGLGSYVFTDDPEQAQRVADRLDVGMVFINGVNADGVELPFGGVKRSGFGRELGRYGIEEFVNKKLIRTIA